MDEDDLERMRLMFINLFVWSYEKAPDGGQITREGSDKKGFWKTGSKEDISNEQ